MTKRSKQPRGNPRPSFSAVEAPLSGDVAALAAEATRVERAAWHAKRLPPADSLSGFLAYQNELDSIRASAASRATAAQSLARQIVRMGFDFAAIQLISAGAVESVAAVGCAAAWAPMARHALRRGRLDIHASIIRDADFAEEIAGWNPRFDRQIYKMFSHEKFRRVFVPLTLHFAADGSLELGHGCRWQLVGGGKGDRVARLCHRDPCRPAVIGTVEAGVKRDRGAFSPEALSDLLQVCSSWSNAIFRESLDAMLTDVAQLGRDVLDADSCAFHYSRAAEVFVMEREAAFPAARRRRRADGTVGGLPRRNGIGARALKSGLPVCVSGAALARLDPAIRREDVAAVVAVPVVAGLARGLIYMHWRRAPSWMTSTRALPLRLDLVRQFARDVGMSLELVLQEHEARQRARRQATLGMMIEVARSGGPRALNDVASALLNTSEADFVALVPNAHGAGSWTSFAVGDVTSPTPMPTRLTHSLALRSAPLLVNNRPLRGKLGGGDIATWLDDEGTVACAVVPVFGSRGGLEAALFVGFRRRHRFEPGEQELFELFARIAGLLSGRQETRAGSRGDAAAIREVEARLQSVGGVLPTSPDTFPQAMADGSVVSFRDFKRRQSLHRAQR